MPIEGEVSRRCSKEACAIQRCLKKAGYQEKDCVALIKAWEHCSNKVKEKAQQQADKQMIKQHSRRDA
jgi:Mature-T-Cell Proliferation I type